MESETRKDSYHHGNLRNELILAGLKIVSEEGYDNLSLRKAATMCGVSHAAPKSHFKDKEEFTQAIREYVEDHLSQYFENAIHQPGSDQVSVENGYQIVRELGFAYVKFYIDNPECYWFMLKDTTIDINVAQDHFGISNSKSFQLFRDTTERVMRQKGMSDEEVVDSIIGDWAIVNGLTGMLAMKGFHYEGDLMELTKRCLGDPEAIKRRDDRCHKK